MVTVCTVWQGSFDHGMYLRYFATYQTFQYAF